MNNEQAPNIQEGTIDLRELFLVLKKRKKLIYLLTGFITILAIIYSLIATPWFQANATIEMGKYKNADATKEIYIEEGKALAERLNIKYIDIYKNIKNRNSKITSITASKKNSQFITISSIGKNNEIAADEINNIVKALQARHKIIIDEIISRKKSELDEINRNIYKVKSYDIVSITSKIEYENDTQLPSVAKKISTIQLDLNNSIKRKGEAMKNLVSLKNDAALAALRLAQIQGLEYKISANELKLIDLNTNKQNIIKTVLPDLLLKKDKLIKIDLIELAEKHSLTKLSMEPYNYHNTTLVGKIIINDTPVKPKKKLIVIVAFITGLMLSIFLAFFLEFISSARKENEIKRQL